MLRHLDLGDVVTQTVDMLEPKVHAAGLVVATSIEPALPVYGDEPRLQQVVINLVSNAVKFTPPGGRLHVDARRADGVVRLTVVDSGLGMEPDALPRVFDRFYQATGSGRRHGGLGLGLAIAKHIVELHAGSITAYSAGPGQGASFTVTLPIDA
ncbi:MAG: HAMP domain-containing histidine kinase [Candidatus Rokubacteria bacterium]|nr:HAMP domain-containing histidine kinase [Candidatus Rokubacteria bacterium]